MEKRTWRDFFVEVSTHVSAVSGIVSVAIGFIGLSLVGAAITSLFEKGRKSLGDLYTAIYNAVVSVLMYRVPIWQILAFLLTLGLVAYLVRERQRFKAREEAQKRRIEDAEKQKREKAERQNAIPFYYNSMLFRLIYTDIAGEYATGPLCPNCFISLEKVDIGNHEGFQCRKCGNHYKERFDGVNRRALEEYRAAQYREEHRKQFNFYE